jgi:hypothetical protein
MHVGLHLLGLSDESPDNEEVPWWEDQSRGRSRTMAKGMQPEFWSDETKQFAQPAEPRVEARTKEPPPPQPVEVEKAQPRKGKFMSMLAIAKFLHVNGSLYDGRDERRRLALPVRKQNLRVQLTTQEPSEYCGTLRSLPRDFSGIWTRRGDGILS